MAGIKISDLPAAPSAQLTDVFPVDQGATTYKESNSQLISLFKTAGEALTSVNDTNVTMTLGGSPTTALLNATSMTLGWTGTLSGTRGGTGVNNGASTITLGGSLTTVGAFASTFTMTGITSVTFPTSGTLATTAGTVSSVSGTLNRITSTGGTTPVIDISASYVGQSSITTVGALASGSLAAGFTPVTVPIGGTGNTTFTAYSVICAGTTATGAFQNVSGLGNAGEQLTSNGAGALPTWQASGTVSPLTTKGDLYTFTTVNARLPVGSTNGQVLQVASGAASGLAWSTATFPTVGGTSGNILISDGTNYIASTSLWPNTVGTAGKILRSDGTTNTYTTATFPTTAGSSGNVLTSDGTNWSSSAPTGSGTVNSGTIGQIAYYAATGTAVSGENQVTLAQGGTNASLTASNGGIFYSTASAGAILAGTATAGQMLQSGASTTPAWSTSTYPATNAINTLLYASSANVMAALATANSSVLVTSSGGVPSLSTTLPNINIGTPSAGVLTNTSGYKSLRSFQIFTSGSGTYTLPANISSILVECNGGGGGGGGCAGAVGQIACGGGGGGGGYARKFFSSPAATYSYGVGASGTGATAGNNAGGAGGTTTFSTMSVTGGAGGGGSAGSAVAAMQGTGGTSGGGSGGDVNIAGGIGTQGGGLTTYACGGAGASSPLHGAGTPAAYTVSSGTTAGLAGLNYGGGGGGAISINTASNGAGGAGGTGLIMVWEFA